MPRRRDEPANLFAYAPIIAAAVEIPWIVVTIIAYVVFTGGKSNNPNAIPLFDLMAMTPAMLGLVLGIGGVRRRRPRLRVEWICFGVGCLLCALFVFSFGYEMSTHVRR